MTQSKYTARARAARPQVLEVLATQATWPLEQLQAELNLPLPVLQELLADLVATDQVRQRFVASDPPHRPGAAYSLNGAPPLHDPHPLSPVETQVLTFLLGRKETLTSVCTALRLSKTEVAQALTNLDTRDLITCKFVGHLTIFSVR
ncbi:hypothetical protein [Deinococcus sp. QL22]|uniref:hypothetical protein n=1 Tax=Deinococcus sp. QL22 TaxID=2939437 RepID=UPI002017F0FA|nr:hypothetical protein [Deinococcus sp. QL22]UQN09184.1 hypothetical protein M1R55_24430 [Deinococcus sp. QL22]